MFSKLRLRKGIAYLLIWLQLLTPGLSMLPMVARASEPADMQSTIQGLNALILGNDAPAVSPSSPKAPAASVTPSQAQTPAASAPSSRLSDYFHVQAPAATPAPEAGLPSLTSPKAVSDKTNPDESTASSARGDEGDNRLASGAMQMGSLLSQDNTSDAAINYARSIGEGLINQQVNDWLNQYGNAKVSLGTHQNVSGDLLVPLTETDKSLVFSQVGARTNQDRNTVNLGFGYRQYLNDWMLGINTFYDYDYTGKNKRIGVGTEAWTDYLKLAANGYVRQTNWHQSKLDDMEDYDERPANGFDLRANAYLPSWPNWGGSLKYEQYFGKGVSVAESASPDSLKDNPVVVTAGVDYTPFPLMTLSAKRSIGDSNETNVGLDFTYRFGVPWEQQIDPDSVGLMRSLVGSKYDFVDRNYNIVMQYRKQELLTISLPAATTAQAAETVPVILTVSKAKYGLKSVSWNVDATLTARGGRYQQVSPTELRVTLPAYVFGQRTNAAQNYKISAVATDNNGNQSNTAETLIGVIPSENTVSNLTISPSDKNLPANDTESYTLTGTVTDGKGAPLANQKVTFAVTGLINAAGQAGTTLAPVGGGKGDSRQLTVTTGMDGKATITLRSKVAGEGKITATMDNGNSSTAKVTFIADTSTAAVTALVAEDDNATADGKATNSVLITVKDKFGNPVNGADVYLTASNEAKIVNKVSTNEQGSANVTLTSTKAGPSTVAASLNDSQKEVTLTFGAGKPDQDKSGISTDKGDYVAGDDIAVSVVLRDGQNNSISGKSGLLTDSAVTVPNAVVKSGSKWVEETQSPGTYTRHYVAKTASVNQHATLNLTGWSKTSNVYNITANMKTAAVVSLEVKDNNAVADGTAKNSVIVTVEDNYQNRVTGAVVSLAASNDALIAESETTGPAGTVLVTLTNAKAGVSAVSASLNSSSKSVNVSFGVGEPVKANSSIKTNKTSYISGSEIQIEVTLADQKQNAVAGLNSTKLNSMVTAANAEAKSTTNWVESSTAGRYVGTYVAKVSGENLTATLKISDGNTASEMYAITAGEAVLANSTISRDSASYVSGTDIQVTVTLKDGNSTPNPVTGLSSDTLASMVTVANADAKSKTNWVESATKGTYVGTYVARAAGTGLKATLTIGSATKDSATYAITAGEAVLANSTISRDSDSYVSGTDIQVTVTLKDGNSTANSVTGLSSATLAGMVTVANADAKSAANWVESSTKGTYVGTYVARAAGTGLVATLTIAGAGKNSTAYAITAGDAVLANSTISRDSASYTSGTDIQVTVMLKDGNSTPNPVTGLSSDTLAGMVTVANAEAKSAANWVESSTKGTYVGTYVARAAGAGLKATLTIGSGTKDSAAYSITAGSAVLANSTITRDSDSYVSGADIKVTVTLKDGNTPTANPVTGLSSDTLASMVTVANADAKSKTNWVESSTKGTYVGAYVARAAGTGLKATLTIAGAGKDSAAYAITAGSAVLANSTITRDSDSYVSGNDIQVTVTLKDGNATPNPVTGLSSDTLASMVTVANAEAKSKANWVESTTKGTYVGTYVARAAGAGLKATLTIADASKDSTAYAITAGDAVLANSTISRDSDSYVSGTDIQVTVTLKDGNATPNPVTGLSSDTLASMVTVANADAKSKANWVESTTKGTYVGAYVARAAGTGLQATLTIGSTSSTTKTYSIVAGGSAIANSTITRDSESYVSGAEIKVTVTLKDGNTPTANPVTGLSSATLAGMVAVANADAKTSTNWVESATKGTYVGTYVARAADTGLKATLTIGSSTKDSATYAITAGNAVLANSTIARDSDSYVSGADIKVTVTLKDGNTPTANPVTGLSSATLAGMVAVANADAKTSTNWVESATKGTYVGTYVARAADTGLKATLTIGSSTKDSATYAITAGNAVLANSTISRDSDSYVSGADIKVTVTLKDGNTPTANPVTGLSSATLAGMVAVANADAKTSTNWVESATKGTYVGLYVAKAAGTGLKAVLTIGSATKDSATYAITAGNAVLANSTIARDSDSYVSGADIKVTVTLKDGNTPTANPVTGLSSDTLASMVTVANADAKSKTNWVESSTKGTYVGAYVARAAGTGLKATLTIAGAGKDSAAYAITAGSAVLANSTITRDSDSYVSGNDIQVTVTLKDGNATPNPVTGLSSDTLASMVTVANAEAKSKANWVESTTKGTYVGTYVARAAGAGLKATLTIADASKDSTAYAITAGDAVLANSTISRDSDSYVSGTDIQVTVTLKDGNATPNPVTGLSSDTLASMVTVANAEAKSKANWVESTTKGTYVGTYVARAAGAGLKATLTIADASKDSTAYAITAGDAVLANSTISRDSDSYVSGTDIQVTVTLKDGNATPNPVTGLSSDTLASMVTVANADAKSKTNWVESTTKGTYVGAYVAKVAGTGLKATLTIAGTSNDSTAYAITAGDAVLANSTITRDSDSYVAGTEMIVKVTLQDGEGNKVTGQEPSLISGAVTVANAVQKAGDEWVEETNNPGVYTGLFIAEKVGISLEATLNLNNWSKNSEAYSITFGSPDLTKGSFSINKPRVVANSIDNATLSLHVVDRFGNGISDLSNINFIVEDSTGKNIAVSAVSAGAKAGDYTALISGSEVGSYKVKAKLDGDDFSFSDVSVTLYSYSFSMTPEKKIGLISGTFKFIINAIPSDYPNDDTKYENVNENVQWGSSDSGVASISLQGVVTGISTGYTTITASGSYNGYSFSGLTSQYGVDGGGINSNVYGSATSSDSTGRLVIQQPDYSLLMNCGSIVDGIGTSESVFYGGKGGDRKSVSKLNLVSSVKIYTGEFRGPTNKFPEELGDTRQLTSLIFNLEDGSSVSCGSNINVTLGTIVTEEFIVPKGQVLEGLVAGGNHYLHTIQFITRLSGL